MATKLEYVFTLRVGGTKETFCPMRSMKGDPTRFTISIHFGSVEGPDVKAEFIAGGNEWFELGTAPSVGQQSMRAMAKTAEGEFICMRITGIVKIDEQLQKSLEWAPDMKTTHSEDHYWLTTPTFETDSGKLKWLEQYLFIAHGQVVVHD